MRIRPVLVGLLTLATVLLAGCGGSSSNSNTTSPTTTSAAGGTTLEATVGPGFTISLTQNGQSVSTLEPGKYTINVDDKSDIHNFHLTGDGVDVSTDVGTTGTDSFDITVTSGTYTFVCDPHSSTMHGSFDVSG